MTTLNLLVKTYSASQIKQIEQLLTDQFGDLDVNIQVLGNKISHGVKVELSGEDEAVATSYISREFGISPTNIENVQDGGVFKGYITKVSDEKRALIIDLGVSEPKLMQAIIPLTVLQAQLADGKNLPLKQIAKNFGLDQNVPVSVKVVGRDAANFQAELSEEQLKRLVNWRDSLLDRLIVLGASKGEVEQVLERTGLFRDVIAIDSLGLFEQALTCKLGTDAAGLIPRVGRYMKFARFLVFNPRFSLNF